MSKTLYVLVSDGGDGSYYPQYTLNYKLIAHLQELADSGTIDYESGVGIDGDGFHFGTIQVPDDATPESLGIRVLDEAYWFSLKGDEDEYYCKRSCKSDCQANL